MKEYLSDLEIVKIEQFYADVEMREAVKKVILQHLYAQGVIKAGEKHNPLHNRALALVGSGAPNDELGAQLRALWEGVNALETGFDELGKITSKKEAVETPYNPAI